MALSQVTPARIAKRAATCGTMREIINTAVRAQISELQEKLAGCIARDVADEMTDNAYFSRGSKAQATARINAIKAEIQLLESAL